MATSLELVSLLVLDMASPLVQEDMDMVIKFSFSSVLLNKFDLTNCFGIGISFLLDY